VTLLLPAPAIPARRAAVTGGLAQLAASLRTELQPVMERELFVPAEKARLTRAGGRCPVDAALLAFDPALPHVHRCPVCGIAYRDEAHHRWWIMWYQLWLAERAVHGAVLHLLTGDRECAHFAERVLDAFAERYADYPNQDNVLGPGRPFFSTYLESIWLLQLCVAVDALEAAGIASAACGRVRDRVIAPSRAIIRSYDEGASNRQVWNNAALLASARLLDDDRGAEHALFGPSGLVSHLDGALLADGSWYEGENYHQFAHRGLWYGMTMADAAGIALPAHLVARFDEGFVAPFLTALPDLTLPARRDSQYGISLRQWRYAESCELGLARGDDARLAGSLARLYDSRGVRRDTGRWRSAAESERNEPASTLTRADLGWRSLLLARESLPVAEPWSPPSVLMEAQGLAVFRREAGRVYVALDYGHSGGGHGHPDRLNVLWSDGATRVLDDMGTGSYVDRSLHWYRSTLAHDAPLVNGHSQQRGDGELYAHDEHGDVGWVDAGAWLAPDVRARRSLVVGPGYIVDRLSWTGPPDTQLDLPLHVHAVLTTVDVWREADAGGAGGLEDGFDFLRDTRCASVDAGRVAQLALPIGATGRIARASIVCDVDASWWSAVAPGAPGQGDAPLFIVRARSATGTITTVWHWHDDDADEDADDDVITDDAISVTASDGARHEHRRGADGATWHIHVFDDEGRVSHLVLAGTRASVSATHASVDETQLAARRAPIVVGPALPPAVFELGEAHYRRSEPSWHDAGAPSATVAVAARDDALVVTIDVRKRDLVFVEADAVNELDNERADINGDGVQLYLATGDDSRAAMHAWLLVPELGGERVRITPLTDATPPLQARWARADAGYSLECIIARAPLADASRFALDVLVNESAPGRERRRGQLVLSGAHGAFVYLQGDRHDRRPLLDFVIQPPPLA